MELWRLIRSLRAGEIAFAAVAVLACLLAGPAALEGLPRLLAAVTPGMAAEAKAPAQEIAARLAIAGLPPSRFAPQILYPIAANDFPAWMRQAPQRAQKPVIAICVDDLGEDVSGTEKALRLPGAVTLSFLPYAELTPAFAAEARAQGHGVIAHVPMQPLGAANPGPMALEVGMDRDEILRRLIWSLARVPGAAGINNHEGSRFTADAGALAPVMQTLAARHLFFFDSRTSPVSVGVAAARAAQVPAAGRDIFLDDDPGEAAVKGQLDALLAAARRQGVAIAIGHPHEATLRLLAAWLAEDHGVTLVPLAEAIRLKGGREADIALK